jgi:hypothetical protein
VLLLSWCLDLRVGNDALNYNVTDSSPPAALLKIFSVVVGSPRLDPSFVVNIGRNALIAFAHATRNIDRNQHSDLPGLRPPRNDPHQ